MPWNPEIYNQYKSIRYRPFYDVMGLISGEKLNNAVDVGCGTGEQTSILSRKFGNCSFLGIDSSEEMLAQSKKYIHGKLSFRLTTIEVLQHFETFPAIYSFKRILLYGVKK